MTTVQLSKIARKLIQKDGMSHQQAFELMSSDQTLTEQEVAEAVSKTPTREQLIKTTTLRKLLIYSSILFISINIINICLFRDLTRHGNDRLIPLILYNVVLPAMTLFHLKTQNYGNLRPYSILSLLVMWYMAQHITINWSFYLAGLSGVQIVFLSFIIAAKSKVPYSKKTTSTTGEDGVTVHKTMLVFDE